MRDEVFDLLAGGVAKGLDAAEVGRIGLDQVGIELMLANELAKAVANLRAAVAISVGRLRRELLRLSGDCGGSAKDPISSTEQMPIP